MSTEKPIYLNVKPFSQEPQLIHMESIAGCNIAFTGNFTCHKGNKGSIKLKEATFEMYRMFGLLGFGFKKIEAVKEPHNGKRILKFELGFKDVDYVKKVDFSDLNIEWSHNDIIDNKITFNIYGLIIEREQLAELLENIGLYDKTKEMVKIPKNGRPCQFKLVTELQN